MPEYMQKPHLLKAGKVSKSGNNDFWKAGFTPL
jgi:hypothetical protein